MASGFKFQLGTSRIRNKTATKLTLTFRGQTTRQERTTDRVKHTASAPASPQTGNPSFPEYVDAFMQTAKAHFFMSQCSGTISHLLLSPKTFRHFRTVVFRDVTSRDVLDNRYKYTTMCQSNTTNLYYVYYCIRATCFNSYRIICRPF